MTMNEALGYYVVDKIKFESKIHALIHATNTGKKIKWVFNNDTFENFNWSQEPVETLDQLYDARVRDLRERYDHLVLCYSGGSDSNNILESFIRQGLLIDEIVTNFIVEATKPITTNKIDSMKAENHNAEWDLLARHRMQYIKDKMPKAKISNFDMSKPILDHFKDHDDGSWVLKCKEWANPMSTSRYNIIHDMTMRKQFDKSKTVGVILGVDKPQLVIRDDKLYLHFVDTTANITPMTEHIRAYDNSTVEFFYWSPDSARMLCKQAHVMLKWLKTNPQHQRVWDWTSGLPTSDLYKSARNIKEHLLKGIVYSTWNYNWFQAEKGTIGWTNANDNWFFDYFKGTIEYTAWENGIKYLLDNISHDHMMPLDGVELERFKPIYSNSYYIGYLDNAQ